MALITGTASDCNLAAVENFGLELVFTISAPATSGSALLITRDVVVPVTDGGAWQVDLPPTETMGQPRHYKMCARWRDPHAFGDDAGMAGVDFPDFELFVPDGGGTFAELVHEHGTWNPLIIIYSPTTPSFWPKGALWWDTSPDESPTSGHVRERTA